MTGKYNIGYYINWGGYARNYHPNLIPTQDLTHLLYAFGKPDVSGEVSLSDPGQDKGNDPRNLYGNLGAIFKLKHQHRHLKVLFSIGGYTYSPNFHPIVIDQGKRAKFVQSAVKMLEDCGFDGLDIDYEYPSNQAQAAGYCDLLKELRAALDEHAHKKGISYKFLLTIAAPCGPDKYKVLDIRGMVPHLDFWNLMAYDFSGSWDRIANHQANIYGSPINASDAVNWYIDNGVPASKVVLGCPAYGRSFLNTDGPGTPFKGIGPGSWEAGVYDYRSLLLHGAVLHEDEKNIASWSYDPQKREMISFDSEKIIALKAKWILEKGLAGSMFWELTADKGIPRQVHGSGPGKDLVPGKSLVTIAREGLSPLDDSQNWLKYEGSQYDNVRKATY